MSAKKDKYAEAGVDYSVIDQVKTAALLAAAETSKNLIHGREVSESRGESAYLVEFDDFYLVTVTECLGTKALVADAVREITGKSYYDQIAQDALATAFNDIVSLGADPQIINAYWAAGRSEWFADKERSFDLIRGWKNACNVAGAAWGGGESPSLSGVIFPEAVDLACSCVGIIKPKERIALAKKMLPGDAILIVESSGIHANGLSLARRVTDKLPQGYATKISDGRMYGEALLDPTVIYVPFIKRLFANNIDIHYMTNITGHGLRKIMRADRDLTYVLERLPQVPSVLSFIQEQLAMSDKEAYSTFNMGAGFAIFLPAAQVALAQLIALHEHKLRAVNAGYVEEGLRRVVIKPKDIVFEAESLRIR